MKNKPQFWRNATTSDLKKVKGVCLDIDDTLSTHGKLTATAYNALWELKNAGFFVVPVTGRPAGWCDHIVRFWPVDAVIGENGAFTFFMEGGVRRRLDTMGHKGDTLRKKIEALGVKIKKRFPCAVWASDQSYREYDLAIDICEDVKPWKKADVEALLSFCEAQGAQAKLSSIHVNAWFGDYDKRSGFESWLKSGAPGLSKPSAGFSARAASDQGRSPATWLFVGDSPNDEPLFGSFAFSVGVANLKKYLDRLRHPPRWITDRESGEGFAEMATRLVALRRKRA